MDARLLGRCGAAPRRRLSDTVAGKREEQKSEEKGAYRSEFRYGSFSRSLTLPAGADPDAVKASYKDGVLEVRVHVDEVQSKGAKVPVEHA